MTMPSQKTGMETPISASTVMARSDSLPALMADTTPTTIPKKSQMMAAPIASENVAGSPSLIWSRTFCWLVYDTSDPENIFCIIL